MHTNTTGRSTDRPRNAPPLVGLIGRKRSGKDTFADVLIARAGFTKAGFADPLREAALSINPIVSHALVPDEFGLNVVRPIRYADVLAAHGYERAKDLYPEFRAFLQHLGTDGIRKLDPGFWVRLAEERIDARTAPYVLTDVRFPNEADAIRKRGGYLIRIERPSAVVADEHESESALDGYPVNVVLSNDKDLSAFLASAQSLAASLGAIVPRPL